jgi:hypothetical protein
LIQNFITEQLKGAFTGRESLSRKELFDFYRQFEPDLKDNTFRWKIHNLKAKNIISPLSRQQFTLAYKPVFEPLIGETERKIATLIQRQFKELRSIIWSTRIISEFMLHQPGRFLTIVEVEKDAVETVFHFLRDGGIRNVFLDPQEKEIEKYISDLENAIVILPLISKSPIQKIKGAGTITLEKLLVDLFSNKQLFYAYQGSELSHIYNNAYRRYAIDFTRLASYAARRGKDADLVKFISLKTDIPKDILND